MSCDDLQTIPYRNRSPPRSPFLTALLRRQSKNDHSQIKFKEQRRIVVLGAAKVGKSSIIQQFLYDQFSKRYNRTIEDLHVAEYNSSNGASLRLEILDTTGYYQFPAMRALSISNGNAFLLVYSVDDEESWKYIEEIRHQVCFTIILTICYRVLFDVKTSLELFCSRLFILEVLMCQSLLLVINLMKTLNVLFHVKW